MLDIILKYSTLEDQPKKLKILEVGSGRGGLTRYMAKELLKRNMLDSIMAANIAERENMYNLEQAIKEGIPKDKFDVMYLNFDEID